MAPRKPTEVDRPATIERRLTQRQRDKRDAILVAAYALADEVAYEDFSTRDVAARAGVAIGTLYHYFATKDHLIAAATLAWVREFDTKLAEEPLEGRTPVLRIADLLGRQARRAREHPELYRSYSRAFLSGDAATRESRRLATGFNRRWFELALGKARVADRVAVIDLLSALTLTTLLSAASREDDAVQDMERLEAAVRQILRG